MATYNDLMNCLNAIDINFTYSISKNIIIESYALPDTPTSNSIIWIKHASDYDFNQLTQFENILIVTGDQNKLEGSQLNYIASANSKGIFFSITNFLFQQKQMTPIISSTAVIETELVGNNLSVGHHSYIGPNVKIGNNVTIKHSVTIEGPAVIGNDVLIHSGTTIGTDGYGYFQIKGEDIKIHHLGGVQIGDKTEIGSNTCIDRGTLKDTIIGRNVKIDNLCHIAHNVIIEDHVNVIALSLVAGSVHLKEHAYIAPSASIRNQLTIGKNSVVGLGAVVTKSVPDNVTVAGVPAKEINS